MCFLFACFQTDHLRKVMIVELSIDIGGAVDKGAEVVSITARQRRMPTSKV
jgi:hypothetical protein